MCGSGLRFVVVFTDFEFGCENEGKGWSSKMDKLVEEAEMQPLEFVMELAKGLREAMGLRLFIFLGTFFMFKICVNGERDKYHFLILFLLHFCSIFCVGRRET